MHRQYDPGAQTRINPNTNVKLPANGKFSDGRFQIVDTTQVQVNGTNVPLHRLNPNSCTTGNELHLPWKENEITQVTIPKDNQATQFSTARMDSCGVVIHGPRDNPTVSHINAPPSDRAMEKLMQSQNAWPWQKSRMQAEGNQMAFDDKIAHVNGAAAGIPGPNKTTFGPQHYQDPELRNRPTGYNASTVFGTKNDQTGDWTFYANTHIKGGSDEKAFTQQIWPKADGARYTTPNDRRDQDGVG